MTFDRFWSKVDKTPSCWIWTAVRIRNGYGRFSYQGRRYVAHRFAYELVVGPIPEGLQLDHLCGVKCCVNPDHLEPVTNSENQRRAKVYRSISLTCPKGHPRAKYYVSYGGKTRCRECFRLASEMQRRQAAPSR